MTPPYRPAVAAPAASVVLIRDPAVGAGVEVYMLRRPASSAFAAGALVFPGGAVDAGDRRLPPRRLRTPGPRAEASAADRSARREPRRLLTAFRVAAVRELLEETGVLLAEREDGTPLRPHDDVPSGARRHLLDGGDLRSVLDEHRLRLRLDELVYAAHFATPLDAPRRFDARFFLARAPLGQTPAVHAAEATKGGWFDPRAVVADASHGSILPPTRVLCTELGRHASTAEALAAFSELPLEHVPRR